VWDVLTEYALRLQVSLKSYCLGMKMWKWNQLFSSWAKSFQKV